MKEVDPGHEYLLDSYDGGEPVRLVFMKREGEGYPYNVGHHPGTNCQEVLRANIARIQHLQRQIPCDENLEAIRMLRRLIWLFEIRAAERHKRVLPSLGLEGIEMMPTCRECGHIGCTGHLKRTNTREAGQSDNLYDGAILLLRSWAAFMVHRPSDWERIAAKLLADTQALLRDEAAREESFFASSPDTSVRADRDRSPHGQASQSESSSIPLLTEEQDKNQNLV